MQNFQGQVDPGLYNLPEIVVNSSPPAQSNAGSEIFLNCIFYLKEN